MALPGWSVTVELPAGLPGWRRTACLGCDERVVANRDPHVVFVGTRDGSVLIVIEGEPQRLFVTSDQVPEAIPLFVLGAAHRDCAQRARRRLETPTVSLPEQLPLAYVEPHDGELERLHIPPVAGRCPFCGAVKEITDEDVWPRWISKLLRERFGSFRVSAPSGYRQLQRINYVAPICSICNNRWMSVQEKDVKPTLSRMILGPQPNEPPCQTLTPAQQEVLATWAVKTAFMIDFCGKAAPIIPTGYYQQLRMYRRALPNTVVWVAGYNGNQCAVFAAHGGLHIGIEPGLSPNAFMTVFTAYRVIFKVFGYIGPAFPQDVSYDSAFGHGVSQIWPVTGHSIEWPRNGMAFNDDTLMPFAKEQPKLQSSVT